MLGLRRKTDSQNSPSAMANSVPVVQQKEGKSKGARASLAPTEAAKET
jgi:hypothetical protein